MSPFNSFSEIDFPPFLSGNGRGYSAEKAKFQAERENIRYEDDTSAVIASFAACAILYFFFARSRTSTKISDEQNWLTTCKLITRIRNKRIKMIMRIPNCLEIHYSEKDGE